MAGTPEKGAGGQVMKCYKCREDMGCMSDPLAKVTIDAVSYKIDVYLCDNCIIRIEQLLQVNGYEDEEEKD